MTRRVVGDLIRACVAWTWLASSMMPLAAVAQPHAPEGASGWRHQSPVAARRWMVTAANPFAVDAGYGVLRRGGNAIDAAVAMQLVLGLTEPQSSGLGGGGLMLVHDGKRRRIVAYDGRETAPAAATPERFMKDGQPLAFYDAVIGGRSVGVPGTLRLLETAHRRHGKLAWASLCAPAIALAEKGFALSPRLHALIAADKYLPQQGRARSYFYDVQGQALPAGTILRNPAYANTLRRIAAE